MTYIVLQAPLNSNQPTNLLFGSKLGFGRILDLLYGAIWQCLRVRL